MENYLIYEQNDKMAELISSNSDLLQMMGCFGITLGFGDETVDEVCTKQHVDTMTFLTIVNFVINGYYSIDHLKHISFDTLLTYLRTSHEYYTEYQLPQIREKLRVSVDSDHQVGRLIIKIFEEYARAVKRHLKYEETEVFPYVEELGRGVKRSNFYFDTYPQGQSNTNKKLKELRNIIVKYLPADGQHNFQLAGTLHDLANMEKWLTQHGKIEDKILMPAIKLKEEEIDRMQVSDNIHTMLTQTDNDISSLSQRECEVIKYLVQGMTNQEVAKAMELSVNTVISHRRNVARKLQIHTVAGLTVFAVVNGLIDIEELKL